MAPTQKVAPKRIQKSSSSGSIKKVHVPAPSTPTNLNTQERVELKKLEKMLPMSPRNSDPTDVVLRAASYIDQLVATVQARVKNGTLPIEALDSLPPVYSASVKSSIRRMTSTKKTKRSMEKKR
uniref:BHLH domain-containing protein n=1 Tax=Caenorhabditis tropicalis TaxID=1561998 RepID=A0A1I7T1Q5_9PELO